MCVLLNETKMRLTHTDYDMFADAAGDGASAGAHH
jgi:hypothetical protein